MTNVLCDMWNTMLRPSQSFRKHNSTQELDSDTLTICLFADDKSFIIANHDETEFKFKINEIFNEINKWFHSNLLM